MALRVAGSSPVNRPKKQQKCCFFYIIPSLGAYARHNRIERIVCDLEGHEKRREFVTENHAFMVYNPLLEGPQS